MALFPSNALPPGYVFEPEDNDLVNHYLIGKIKREIDVGFNFIQEMDIYQHEPSKLSTQVSGKEKMYFFTPLHWKNENNADRQVPNGSSKKTGFWRKTGQIEEIKGEVGKSIAKKTSLAYYEYAKDGKSKPGKTQWLMKEYMIYENKLPNCNNRKANNITPCTLCVIYYRPPAESKNRRSDANNN